MLIYRPNMSGRDPDQPKHVAQANPDIHFSPPVDFLFQASLLYTSIPPGTECVCPDQSARTAMTVDTLRRGHYVCFLAERLIFHYQQCIVSVVFLLNSVD